MDAYALYKSMFFDYIGPYGGYAGVNMARPNFKPGYHTYAWICANIAFVFGCLFTVFTYELEIKEKTVSYFGLTIQGLVKFGVLMTYAPQIQDKVKMVERLYLANRDTRTPYYVIVFKWAKICHLFVKWASLPCAAAMAVMVLWPIPNYFLSGGDIDLILPTYYPFIDEDTWTGFVILTINQLAICFLALCGTCGADFMLVVLVVHMWPMCQIWAKMFDQLNEALLLEHNRRSAEVRRHFLNIIYIHKDMCRYLEGISEIYFYMLFCEIFTCGQCLCAVLFCLSQIVWVPLYFFWVLMFTKLLAYCCLGTIAELATDNIYSSIIQSNWYLLPEEQKQYLRYMMEKAQKPTILKAGTMPLNFDTFVNVMKTVYSVGMLLCGTV